MVSTKFKHRGKLFSQIMIAIAVFSLLSVGFIAAGSSNFLEALWKAGGGATLFFSVPVGFLCFGGWFEP
mgnify:CR=1 FL=1